MPTAIQVNPLKAAKSAGLPRSAVRFSLLAVTALGLGSTATAWAQPSLSGTPDELREFLFPRPNTVNINGEAELTAYKDIARVNLMVTTEERELAESMAVNQAKRQQLIDRFIAAGIDPEGINNARFASTPQSGFFGGVSRYEVTARLEVSVDNETHMQLLAEAADQNDEVELESIEFEHSEEEQFEERVREQAVADAMAQKTLYEQQLGIELSPINFFYGGIRRQTRAMPELLRQSMDMAMSESTAMTASSVAGASTMPSSFDKTEYATNVTVVFEVLSESSNTQGN